MGLSLKAMWQYKCPRCRSKDSYLFKTPFQITQPLDMNERCMVCDQNFEPEPGYYYGAMFISYIMSTFLMLPMALILVFYFKWSEFSAMLLVIFVGMVLFIRILRMSRSLWIHFMIKYNPRAGKPI